MDGSRLDRWCERGIFALVISILVYGPLATGAVQPQDYALIKALASALLLLTAIRIWTNPNPRLLLPPVTWPILAFLAYAIGRYLTSDIEFVARQEMIKILIGGSLFLVIVTQIQRTELAHTLTLTLLALATGIALYGCFQYVSDSNRVWHFIRPEIYNQRGSGTYICPNHFAGFLELLLPLGITYSLTSRFNKQIRILLALASVLIFAGIIISVSRGGWLATASSLTVLGVWMLRNPTYRTQALILAAGIGIAGVVFLQNANLSPERREAFTVVDRTEDLRFRLWNPAYEMWLDHPWLGVGPNHFNERFPQYRSAHDQAQAVPQRVHNDYLNTITDWGVIGAILITLIWLIYFRGVVKTWPALQGDSTNQTLNRRNDSALLLGASLGLFALLVHSFVDFNMHVPANALLATALLALASAQCRFASDRFWFTPSRLIRSALFTLLLAAASYVGTQGWITHRENIWLAKAEKLTPFTAPHTAALEMAFAAENKNPSTAYSIGEAHRVLSWHGTDDYKTHATNAMTWLQRSIDLNPWNAYSVMRYGMCLDWLGQHDAAQPYFLKAETLDPNGYYTLAHIGWHHVQLGDYATAQKWFTRSMNTYWVNNPIAKSYLKIIEQRLSEDSANGGTKKQTPAP